MRLVTILFLRRVFKRNENAKMKYSLMCAENKKTTKLFYQLCCLNIFNLPVNGLLSYGYKKFISFRKWFASKETSMGR